MSDHGFASWRRTFNLNRWLEQHGYLVIRDPSRRGDPLNNIDWTRTRAYGLGLNGLYLNLKDREKSGIVAFEDSVGLAHEIEHALLETIDPATHQHAVTAVHVIAGTPSHFERAPDLIVGYAKGTRCSNDSALGAVPLTDVLTDNTEAWSGDHCMDPAGVPGVLFSSRPLPGVKSLQDLRYAIGGAFGIGYLSMERSVAP